MFLEVVQVMISACEEAVEREIAFAAADQEAVVAGAPTV